MKITPDTHLSALLPQSSKPPNQNPPPPHPAPAILDLSRKYPARRRPHRRRNAAAKDGTGAPSGKRVAPPTPLLRWKFDDVHGEERQRAFVGNGVVAGVSKSSVVCVEGVDQRARRGGKGGGRTVSVRKLAASLWRLQAPEGAAAGGVGGRECRRSTKDGNRLGFKQGTGHGGEQLSSRHGSRVFGSEAKGQSRSPCSMNGHVNGYGCEPKASLKFSNYGIEGATKWDPVCPEKNKEPSIFHLFNSKEQDDISMVSFLQSELEHAQRQIEELESARRSSKKKLKQYLLKLSEERAAWRSREHEKVHAIIGDIKADLNRERKNCQRLERVKSKLVNELAESKLAMKKYMQDLEKERKNRELVEEVCDELAKEMGEDKAEMEVLKAECEKIREEVEDEKKMLQMAEVWREERVQMKLIDAKVTVEEKYDQMNKLIAHLQWFLGLKRESLDPREVKESELLLQAAASVKIHEIKEFDYEPPKSDDIFAILEEMAVGETSEREIEACSAYGPERNTVREDEVYRLSNAYGSWNDELDDDDRSGWETVSHGDDHGSSFTPEGSTEWEGNGGGETPPTEIAEVCLVRSKELKKLSAMYKLWRSSLNNGEKYKIIKVDGMNSRLSNGGYAPSDLAGHLSSPDKGNPL